MFDIPSPDELDPNLKYDYNLVWKQFSNEQMQSQSADTYDQFLWLRDTLIDSKKKYPWKRWATLIVGDKERSVEIKYKNRFKASFDDFTACNVDSEWPYVSYDTTYGNLGAIINEDWRYRIEHKFTIKPQANTERIIAYCDFFAINDDWTYPTEWQPIAVYDLVGKFSKTFQGSISGTCHGEGGGSVTGTCSVKVEFKLWDILQKITALWFIERDMRRWDKMEFKAVDENDQLLELIPNSNFFSVQHLDLNKTENGN